LILRILIFLLCAAGLAYAVTVLAGAEGRTTAEAFGLKFDIHTGFATGATIAAFAGAIYLTVLFKDAARWPQAIRGRGGESRRARGLEALARGLEAVAIGDADSAAREARAAERYLEGTPLTRLLTAQAAQLAGDEAAAAATFSAMLASPETEFLGLKGLYLQAMKVGDVETARRHADQAFRLRPKAGWAFESVWALGLDRGAWGEMRDALATAAKHRLVDAERARRGEAALLAADAYAIAAQDERQALREAERALKLAPGFAPAAALAARLHSAHGRRPKAARILEAAYAVRPHAGLLAAHDELYAAEPAQKRADAIERIAAGAPEARSTKLATARRKIVLGAHKEALAILEPLLRERASAQDCALMAEAIAGAFEFGGEEIERAWLQRAAAAGRDPDPGADGSFRFTREGWARLIREFMEHDRLAPPPLEDALGISADDLARLAPPTAPEAPAAATAMPTPSAAAATPPHIPDAEDVERAVAAAGRVS